MIVLRGDVPQLLSQPQDGFAVCDVLTLGSVEGVVKGDNQGISNWLA